MSQQEDKPSMCQTALVSMKRVLTQIWYSEFETKKQFLIFMFVGYIYCESLIYGKEEVLKDDRVHDYFPMDISEYKLGNKDLVEILEPVADAIPLLCLLHCIFFRFGDNPATYLKRLSTMYFLKGLI